GRFNAVISGITVDEPTEGPAAVFGRWRRWRGVRGFGGIRRRRRRRSRRLLCLSRSRRGLVGTVHFRCPSGHRKGKNAKGYSHRRLLVFVDTYGVPRFGQRQ